MNKRKRRAPRAYLLKNIGELNDALRDKYIVLFLDYDGTLAPITDKPSNAKLSTDMKKMLYKLSKAPGLKLAVISGRSLRDIKSMVGLRGVIYSGNHGFQISGQGLNIKRLFL